MNLKLPGHVTLAPEQCKIVACAIVIEKMLPFIPSGMTHETLEYHLHNGPASLRAHLQAAVDKTPPDIKAIIVGYGLCSQGVVGLSSRGFYLVIPKVDDCIAMFLGSQTEYQRQMTSIPGTYYFTKEWIDSGGTPFHEVDELVKQYGADRAAQIMSELLKNYTRLAYIDAGESIPEGYRQYALQIAQQYHLAFEHLPGSTNLLQKMLAGPWDGDFVIIRPGGKVTFSDFKNT